MPSQEGPPFEIAVDERAGIVRLVLRGFWTLADFQAFEAGLSDSVGRARRHHAVIGLFSDSTAFKIQSSEVGDAFARAMGLGDSVHSGPSAIVVGSMLNKFQAERALGSSRVRIFTDFDEAERWVGTELAKARGGAGC